MDFDPNSDPFWDGFGIQIKAKLVQNRTQHRFPRWTTRRSPIGSQLGTKIRPRPPNLEPRSAPDPNFGAKIGPRPPTWSQDGSKTLSRHHRGPILEDLGPILMDLGFHFNDFFLMLVDFGHQLMTKKYTNYQNISSEDTKQIVKLFIIISKLH